MMKILIALVFVMNVGLAVMNYSNGAATGFFYGSELVLAGVSLGYLIFKREETE